ncbi:hypothetical protein [Arcticibacter sp. MXS-1]|uniref:hypothetical protein n=1 Tax=Arcticibacter sp. MXS-1 TaxID=3341726 RepID=UPI0035A94578
MERILTDKEAETAVERLTEKDKIRVACDKVRFGEFYIATDREGYVRVDPINIIERGGKPVSIRPIDSTII